MDSLRDLQDQLCRSMCAEVSLRETKEGYIVVSTPFTFPDGDGYTIYLRRTATGGWRLSDMGNTLMRLSYEQDIEKLRDGTRARVFEQIVAEMGIEDDNGDLFLEAPSTRLGEGVFRFGQALTRIHDIRFLNRIQVESTFFDDLAEELERIVGPDALMTDYAAPDVPDADRYRSDFAIRGESGRPLLIFGVPSSGRARLATIVIQYLIQHDFDFRSLIVYSDMTTIPKQDLARLTTVANDQIPSLQEESALRRKITEAIR
ncbi:hypothetical protein CAL29_18035 [Bordetella genomosp. 10]|uniref:DUF1828 domain-containing protein n=1 Tax=Bordetella genomosp. 10 TaxID=1416804 RepID=A0A261RZ95_9BORD|nr:DUF1828 domain-containing protein [Bordetella genomosp. 10]OZI29982.1 hypothetical protein CAL29_18035 [Bordetella genomosp. 10]